MTASPARAPASTPATPAPALTLSGAISPEWRDISHHSAENAPLNGNGGGRRGRLRGRPRRRGRSTATGAWNLLAVLLSALFGFPIYWMLITAFKKSSDINQLVPQFWPKHPTLRAFREVLGDRIFRDDLRNSFVITLSAVTVSVVIGFFGALAIARFRFTGRRVFVVAVLLVQMIPLIALTIPLSLLLDNYHLKNTIPGVAIAYLMFTTPYTVWTLRTFIANIPPELDEAAMVDGCSRWQTFYKIILPLVAPGLIATGVYSWILAWNEFVFANTLLIDNHKQTAMVYLLIFQSSPTHGADFGGLMAAATLTALPVVLLFALFQSRISVGLTAGAVKG
jgi:N,N'-diacetylchitobiose transport system permease protein